jgi:hypothetical protein
MRDCFNAREEAEKDRNAAAFESEHEAGECIFHAAKRRQEIVDAEPQSDSDGKRDRYLRKQGRLVPANNIARTCYSKGFLHGCLPEARLVR